MSDSYLGATEGELLGAPLARHLAAYSDQRRLFPHHGPLQLTPRTLILSGWRAIPLVYRHQPGSLADAGATHVVLRAGVRIMRRRLTAALILAALIVVCLSGCHFVTVHTSPARHGSAARR